MTDETTTVDTDAADAALWAEAVAAVKGDKPAEAVPTAAPEAPTAPAEATPTQSEPTTETEVDIWESATESQRQAFAELQHRLRSDNGRVGALQRQINELQRQLQAPPKPSETPPKELVDWAVFEREYPDEAKAFKALQSASDAKIQALQEKIDSLSTPADGQFYDLLDAVRPDWRETVNTPDFSLWLSAQDEPTQFRFGSAKISDAVSLLRAYDAHKDAKKAKADQIKQTREQRARNSETLSGRQTQPALDGEVDDKDALWREAVASVRKRRGL